MKNISEKLSLPLVAFAALLLGCGAHAATLYWDTTGGTPGAGNPATGTWDTMTANWSADPAGASSTTPYVDGSDVIFSAGNDATTATVTISGKRRVNSLTFEEGAVTLNGDLDDAGAGIADITVKSGARATINITAGKFESNIDVQGNGTLFVKSIGNGGALTKTGTGTATFGHLSSRLTVSGGMVVCTGGAMQKGVTVNDGGTFRIEGNVFEGMKHSVIVNEGGRVELASGVDQTISFFQGTGTVAGEGAVLRVGGDNKSTAFDGAITGDLDLWVVGAGTFTDNASMEFVIGEKGLNNSILGDGNIILGGSFKFDLAGADRTVGNSWILIDVANLNETFGTNFNVDGFTEVAGGVWSNGSDLFFAESTGILAVIPKSGALAR